MIEVLAKVSCGINNGKPYLSNIPSKIPSITSSIFTLIEVAVPVLLVIMGTIDLFKGVAADKEDEMVKSRKLFVKRLITGALVFFIIAITKFVVSLVDSSNSGKIMDCVNCFINNDCQASPDNKTTTIDRIDSPDINGGSAIDINNSGNVVDQNNNGGSIPNSGGTDNTNTNEGGQTNSGGIEIRAIDDSNVINIGDSGVPDDAGTSTNRRLVGKKTGALTETYSNVNYYLYVPTDATEGMPLVIFLHGIGEKGNMSAVKNLKPVTIVTDGTLSGVEQFIFLAPTSPGNTHWGDSTTWGNLIKLVDYIVTEYSINTSRIYLTGFSAGGCGVWGLVNKYPNKFGAAVAVSCTPGSITPENFRNTPLYAISGGAENYVSGMQKTVNSINNAGGHAQFKTIPNAGHIATQNSYSTKELYIWLLSQ